MHRDTGSKSTFSLETMTRGIIFRTKFTYTECPYTSYRVERKSHDWSASMQIGQFLAVNNRPQHQAPGNKIQCLWGLFPGASCWGLLFCSWILGDQNIETGLLAELFCFVFFFRLQKQNKKNSISSQPFKFQISWGFEVHLETIIRCCPLKPFLIWKHDAPSLVCAQRVITWTYQSPRSPWSSWRPSWSFHTLKEEQI